MKLLHDNTLSINDELFQNEFDNLRKLNHPNIVRFVGYCYETQRQHLEFHGRTVFGGTTYRVLCFEYMRMGSLQRHLSGMMLYLLCKQKWLPLFSVHTISICLFADESCGLDWQSRYEIIKGTCEGLKYLHEGLKESLYHLGLNPDNILLEEYLIQKLIDFVSAKIFDEELTRVTQSRWGTM